MSRCQHLIDISPYDPLCDHPCRLYGGGAVEAECETCQYRIETLEAEDAELRERIVTQKQTIQSYRDESREWHEVADNTQAEVVELRKALQTYESENAKLRELVRHLYEYRQLYFETGIYPTDHGVTEQRMRELGVEVDE